MARYAILEGGVVVNVIEADAGFAASVGAIPGAAASPGDTWDGNVFARPARTREVPAEVEMWRCRCVLIAAGKIDAVMAAIDAIEDPAERALVQAQFEFRPTVRRDSALTERLRQAAGISPAEADDMFVAAAAL